MGFPVESLLLEEEPNSKVYKVLDGKQRSLTLIQFVNNQFKLNSKIKVKEIDGVKLPGLTFEKLNPELQQTILNYNLTFTVVRELTNEERELLFFMRNQAVSLSRLELTRVLMGTQVLDRLKGLLSHPFLTETIQLSHNARKKYTDQQLLIQFLILEMQPDLGFSGKEIMSFAEETLRGNGVPQDIENKLNNVMTYLHDAIGEEAKNLNLNRIHLPMLYLVACDALEQNVSPEIFNAWMKQFFNDIATENNEYKNATTSGSARKTNIDIRTKYIKKHFVDYLTK
jgi:DNA-binding transcriptional MerR regulator